jgi:hypothetical protein
MTTTPAPTESRVQPELNSRPTALPPRSDLVANMLNKTRRHGTPIRRVFVQLPAAPELTPRGSVLAKFRSAAHLDAFLFIHALASAKDPYEAVYPASSWARALGLDANTGTDDDDLKTAKTQWSKNVSKLVSLNLIDRKRRGSRARWVLLDESGDGTDYQRPKTTQDGHWFVLPEAYWLDGHYRELSLPAKVMLLVALSSKPHFALPLERVKDWYGISRSTAQRGFAELEKAGILTYEQSWRIDPNNPRMWSEVREYELLGSYAPNAIRDSMRTRRLNRASTAAPTTATAADGSSTTELLTVTPRRRKITSKGGE